MLENKLKNSLKGVTSEFILDEMSILTKTQIELDILLNPNNKLNIIESAYRLLTFQGISKKSRINTLYNDQSQRLRCVSKLVEGVTKLYETMHANLYSADLTIMEIYDDVSNNRKEDEELSTNISNFYKNVIKAGTYLENNFPDFVDVRKLKEVKQNMKNCLRNKSIYYSFFKKNIDDYTKIIDNSIRNIGSVSTRLKNIETTFNNIRATLEYARIDDGGFTYGNLVKTTTKLKGESTV